MVRQERRGSPKPEAAEKPPDRPQERFHQGVRLFQCPVCRDTGYMAVEVEVERGPQKVMDTGMTPCDSCNYGRLVRSHLASFARIEDRAYHRVPVRIVGSLPFGTYDVGVDLSDPRTPSPRGNRAGREPGDSEEVVGEPRDD